MTAEKIKIYRLCGVLAASFLLFLAFFACFLAFFSDLVALAVLSLGAAVELVSWAIATPAVRANANSIARSFFIILDSPSKVMIILGRTIRFRGSLAGVCPGNVNSSCGEKLLRPIRFIPINNFEARCVHAELIQNFTIGAVPFWQGGRKLLASLVELRALTDSPLD
jgi:hypothetical protein